MATISYDGQRVKGHTKDSNTVIITCAPKVGFITCTSSFLTCMPSVTFDDALIVAEALDRAERGVDFADALHLGKASGCAGFLTLDQRFIKAAQREGIEDVREP